VTESIVAEKPPTQNYIFWGAGILLLVFLLYVPALGNYLQGDDFEWLNSVYQGGQRPGLFFAKINNFYRPLVKFSYWLNYSFFGRRVFYYNLSTVFLHLANLWLFFLLLIRLSGQIPPAVVATLAYGVSALYSEVTLWAAGRPDSLLMLFVLGSLLLLAGRSGRAPEMGFARQALLLLLAAGAAAAKESWIILPFLAFSMLWLVVGLPGKKALLRTFSLFVMLGLYLAYFIGRPLLAGGAAFTAYGQAGWREMLNKGGLLVCKYFGLGERFRGAWWQLALLFVLLAAGLLLFIRRRNGMALFGLIWLGLGIGVSLPIYYAPARYNYIPLMGFWLMIVFFASTEMRAFLGRRPEQRRTAAFILGLPLLLYLAQQAIMLHWEIGDYRLRGRLHEQVADMYQRVRGSIPPERPLLFIDLGKRQAVQETAAAVKGYNKLLFVRKRAIWEQVFLAPLANFLGNPRSALLSEAGRDELPALLKGKMTTLFFNDGGFFIWHDADQQKKVLEYFLRYGELPYKVQVLQFRRAGGAT
jgi:hypothetical protein